MVAHDIIRTAHKSMKTDTKTLSVLKDIFISSKKFIFSLAKSVLRYIKRKAWDGDSEVEVEGIKELSERIAKAILSNEDYLASLEKTFRAQYDIFIVKVTGINETDSDSN